LLKKIILVLGSLLVLAFGAVACGGDDDKKTSGSATAVATATKTASGGGGNGTATKTPKETEDATDTPRPTDDNNGGDNVSCGLLTTEEVSAAIGTEMKDGVVSAANSDECQWDPASEAEVSTLYLTYVRPNGESDYEILDDGSEAVDGLGDKAHWISGIDLLEVLEGDTNLQLQVIVFSGDKKPKDIGIELAQKALARLD
jgi:hypothetical protein